MANPCSLCKASCCRDYIITVTSFDVLRVAEKTKKKPSEFSILSPATMLNMDDSTVLECYSNGQRYDYVLAFKSHPCCFLGADNRCTIYDCTPFTCRRYPISPNGKLFSRASCNPISKLLFKLFGVHLKSSDHIKQIEKYRKIVAKWNKKHGKKEDCISFLLTESKDKQLK